MGTGHIIGGWVMLYKVIALVDDVEMTEVVDAKDPYDAVDVFEIINDCYNTNKQVRIKNVQEVTR